LTVSNNQNTKNDAVGLSTKWNTYSLT